MLRLHLLGRGIHVLGPGNRYVIWVQGCHQRCPGCVSPESRALDGGFPMACEALVQDILGTPGIDGITVSGGEPFLQAEALSRVLTAVRAERDLGVIVYTGYVYETLLREALPGSEQLLAQTDLLIDGPYVDTLNDDGALRGSANQRAIPLTDRYADVLPLFGETGKRETELMVKLDGFRMAGIPSKAMLRTIRGKEGDAP